MGPLLTLAAVFGIVLAAIAALFGIARLAGAGRASVATPSVPREDSSDQVT